MSATPSGIPGPAAKLKRFTTKPIIAIAASVVLILISGIVFVVVASLSGSNGPAGAVKSYFTALKEGSATDALKLSDPAMFDGYSKLLLTDKFFGLAKDRVSSFTVGEPVARLNDTGEPSGNENVPVTYTVAGNTLEASVTVTKGKGSEWLISDAPGTQILFKVSNRVESVITINGVTVSVDQQKEARTEGFVAFLGTYEAKHPGNEWVEPVETTITAKTDTSVFDNHETSQAYQDEAGEAVNAYLEKCLSDSHEVRDHGCPNWIHPGQALNDGTDTRRILIGEAAFNLKWKLVQSPTVGLDTLSDGTRRLSSKEDGDVQVDFDYDTADSLYRGGQPAHATFNVRFTLNVMSTIGDGGPTFSFEAVSKSDERVGSQTEKWLEPVLDYQDDDNPWR